jgi:hypothetical protein
VQPKPSLGRLIMIKARVQHRGESAVSSSLAHIPRRFHVGSKNQPWRPPLRAARGAGR